MSFLDNNKWGSIFLNDIGAAVGLTSNTIKADATGGASPSLLTWRAKIHGALVADLGTAGAAIVEYGVVIGAAVVGGNYMIKGAKKLFKLKGKHKLYA